MKRLVLLSSALLGLVLMTGTADAALSFAPVTGYTVSEVWSGADASHFAIEGDNYYILGTQEVSAGQFEVVVRMFDGTSTVEIARSSTFATDAYSGDAIAIVGGDVYWAQAGGYPDYHANLYKTSYTGGAWTTITVFDESDDLNVFSLSTDGSHVFGVGLDASDSNVAFYLDDSGDYQVLAQIPGDASGGSGFDPEGDFFAGAWSVGSDWASHMYEFSASQVANRLDGTQAQPYVAGNAVADYIVPSNASAVMESDGASLFGTSYKGDYSGTDPYVFDLASELDMSLGTLSGATTSVCTDMYSRDGAVLFMGKDAWNCGEQAVIYELVPEPASLGLLAGGALLLVRRRRG